MVLRQLVGTEIDVTNLKTVITFVRDGVGIEDGERFLLDGGAELSPAALGEMVVDGSLGKAMERLEGTRFASLRPLIAEARETGRLSPVMKELDRHLIRAGASLFRGDPLSVTVVVGFLYHLPGRGDEPPDHRPVPRRRALGRGAGGGADPCISSWC